MVNENCRLLNRPNRRLYLCKICLLQQNEHQVLVICLQPRRNGISSKFSTSSGNSLTREDHLNVPRLLFVIKMVNRRCTLHDSGL